MKLLITGASGLLGINLALEAMREHEVYGVDRGKLKSPPFPVSKANFFDSNAFVPALDAVQPDWVINCAALANLDEWEKHPDQAKILNTDLPRELAAACTKRNIKFIHLSTDAVFDGTREDGAYTEDDEPSQPGIYSQTKLDGEYAVLEANPQAIIARVNFFGWSLSGYRSLGEFFVNNLSKGNTVNRLYRCQLLPDVGQPSGADAHRHAPVRPARCVSCRWCPADEQVPVRDRSGAQVRAERKPH